MIIGLNGYATTGKDEIAKMIKKYQNDFQIRKFSDKLKQVASILTGHSVTDFEDQGFKAADLSMDWFVWSYKLHVTGTDVEPKYNAAPELRAMTVRELLQKLGTDAVRHGLHENTWVNALMADYIGMYDIDTDRTTYPKWIITDTRFLNEASAIKERDGIMVRIDRTGVGPINNHKSETELDHYGFDYRIVNDGSLEDLDNKVKQLLYAIDK